MGASMCGRRDPSPGPEAREAMQGYKSVGGEQELTRMGGGDEERGVGVTEEEGGEPNGMGALLSIICCCCFCVLFSFMGVYNVYKWQTWPTCDGTESSGLAWNSVLPPETTMQLRREGFWSMFGTTKIDVYNAGPALVLPVAPGVVGNVSMPRRTKWLTRGHDTSLGDTMGYWTDLSVWPLRRFSFMDTKLGGKVAMEGKPQFGFFLGMRYDLWYCGSPDADVFHIEQDYWATPFWKFWDHTLVFNVLKGTVLVAKAVSHTNNQMAGSTFSEKELTVTDVQDQEVAILRQESQVQAGFQDRRFFATNLQPAFVPNEVVTFLGAIWELNGADKKSSEQSSSSRSIKR